MNNTKETLMKFLQACENIVQSPALTSQSARRTIMDEACGAILLATALDNTDEYCKLWENELKEKFENYVYGGK